MTENTTPRLSEDRLINVPAGFPSTHYAVSQLFTEAASDRLAFWDNQARQLKWTTPWHTTLEWNRPFASWFSGGRLNASENCLDVHMASDTRNKLAVIWEGEGGAITRYTYAELHDEVARFASVLVNTFNIKPGDRVTIYLPLIPQAIVAMLACARVGAIHSVVFGGFSASSLIDRINDSQSRLVITADGGYRRGSVVGLKSIVDQAVECCDSISAVIVYRHTGHDVTMVSGRDFDYTELLHTTHDHYPPIPMSSEDPLFILYTSGTTGKPKGIIHTTGGYLTHAKYSTALVFDLKPVDIYWCTADVGWITGHTYVVYGPLSNGATIMLYEGAPDYPDKDRFWQIINRHKITILYTAPTAIRAFMKWGDHYPHRHDLSSLRLLGSVGEPINPEAWMWYFREIGRNQCPIVDTWWQTETGGIMITTLPGSEPMRPGYAGKALPGITIEILSDTGVPVQNGSGLLTITDPWPSMARGIWGDNERFISTYWSRFNSYFAGDGAATDPEQSIMVLGRVDDVLNVAGHRIGTMEIESALVDFNPIAEAAVVGITDDIKGQAIIAFTILKEGHPITPTLEAEVINWVATSIGAIAKPKRVIFTPDLPKTRSGKIMRRILKGLAEGSPIGDSTTLANPDIVEAIKDLLNKH